MSNNSQGFPQVGLPIAGPNGQITQTWLQLLISLWQRTGGGQGGGFAPPTGTYVVKTADAGLPDAYAATNTATIDWDFSTAGQAKVDVNQGALVIAESQVTGLTAALAGKVDDSVSVLSGTGLTGGGPLTASLTLSINANGVTNTLLAQAPANTIKGNNTGSTANVTDLTGTQATALLNLFTSTLKGLVPLSGGGTTNYLRADATWTNPLVGGVSGTVSLAKLTGGGSNGSLTVVNGLITNIMNPT